MNYVPRRNGSADEIAHIREVVSRHTLPDFVTGFEVRLGEFMDSPAMWILFKYVGDEPKTEEGMQRWVKKLGTLYDAVRADLLDTFDDRWPYMRLEPAE